MDDDGDLVLGDTTDKHGLSKWTEALISRKVAIPSNSCIGEWIEACSDIPPHLLSRGARGAVRITQRRRKMQATMGATGPHGAQYFSAIEALWLVDYGQLWLRKTPSIESESELKSSVKRNTSKRSGLEQNFEERSDKRVKIDDREIANTQTWDVNDMETMNEEDNIDKNEDNNNDDDDDDDGDDGDDDDDDDGDGENEYKNETDDIDHQLLQDGHDTEQDEIVNNGIEIDVHNGVFVPDDDITSLLMKNDNKSGLDKDIVHPVTKTDDSSISFLLPSFHSTEDALSMLPPSATSASFEDGSGTAQEVDLSLYYTFEDAYMFLASRVPSFDQFLVYSQLRAASFAVVLHKGSNQQGYLVPIFDVYARDGITSFRPSAPGPPDFFVTVAKSSDSLPGPFDLDHSIESLQEYNTTLRASQSLWASSREKADISALQLEQATDGVDKQSTTLSSTTISSSLRYPKPVIKCAIVSHSVVTFFALAGVELATPTPLTGGRGRGRGRGRGGRGGNRGRGRR